MRVFDPSVEWLQALIALINIALVLFCFRPQPLQSDAINFGILFIVSLGAIFGIYGAIYIIPLYGLSLLFVWVFGFSLHSFVPFWLAVVSFKIIKKFTNNSSTFRNFAIASMAIPVFYAILFCAKWNGVNNDIQYAIDKNRVEFSQSHVIPNWVSIAQIIDDGWATEKILKSGIYYTALEAEDIFSIEPNNMGRWNRDKMHDPFVVVASLLFGKIDIPYKDRAKIIRSMYQGRHEMEERLWSGNNLSTTDVQTDIQLFPEHRLSYTEKTFIIHNDLERRWRNQQEAIYSFYLPEGAVITSASLWVFGKEEKSYLSLQNYCWKGTT